MDALEALEKFKSTGTTKPAKMFKDSPTLKFTKEPGQFVIGKYLSRRALKEGSKAGKSVLRVELIETNGKFTIRDGDSYSVVPVKAGDVVDMFAPTALDRVIGNVPIGTEVYIRCDGKVKDTSNGKLIEFYKFDVRQR